MLDNFFIESLLFIAFIIIGLYIPGKLLLYKLQLKIEPVSSIFLSVGLGLLIFTLVNYLLAWVKLEFLVPVIILIADLFAIRKCDLVPKIEKKFVKPLIFVIVLSVLFSATMLVTGKFGNSISYRHDDLWHIALINELRVNFPPDNPGFSGIPLKGYHFFYNFFAAKASSIFFISSIRLHLTFMPIFIAFLWGIGVFSLLTLWSKKTSVALWGVFLTMFGGSFAYILHFQGHPEMSFNTGFGMNQPYGSLYNPPFSISIVIILLALICFFGFLTSKQKAWLVLLTLCVGLISMFKVYAGMILIAGFLIFSLMQLYKKQYVILLSIAFATALFLGTFWFFVGGTGSLIFFPLWPSHRILESYSWYGYEEKMYTYTRMKVLSGIIQTELDGLNAIIFGNLGTRLIGIILLIFIFIKKRIFPSKFAFIVFVMCAISILIPMFFIQSGDKVFEMIQMTQYFLFFSALFASFGLSYLFSLRLPKIIMLILFIITISLTIPSALSEIPGYFSTLKDSQSLSSPYFKAINFLSKQSDYNSTVLEIPMENFGATRQGLNSWYQDSSPAIVAFSNKRSFFNNQYIVFPGLDKQKRIDRLSQIIAFTHLEKTDPRYSDSKNKVELILLDSNIKYIFSPYKISSITQILGIKEVYNNSIYYVYKIN